MGWTAAEMREGGGRSDAIGQAARTNSGCSQPPRRECPPADSSLGWWAARGRWLFFVLALAEAGSGDWGLGGFLGEGDSIDVFTYLYTTSTRGNRVFLSLEIEFSLKILCRI